MSLEPINGIKSWIIFLCYFALSSLPYLTAYLTPYLLPYYILLTYLLVRCMPVACFQVVPPSSKLGTGKLPAGQSLFEEVPTEKRVPARSCGPQFCMSFTAAGVQPSVVLPQVLFQMFPDPYQFQEILAISSSCSAEFLN